MDWLLEKLYILSIIFYPLFQHPCPHMQLFFSLNIWTMSFCIKYVVFYHNSVFYIDHYTCFGRNDEIKMANQSTICQWKKISDRINEIMCIHLIEYTKQAMSNPAECVQRA